MSNGKNVRRSLDRAIEVGSGIILCVAIAILIFEVFTRYFLGFSNPYNFEIPIYLVIVSAFISSGPVLKSEKHIMVTYFLHKAKGKVRTIMNATLNFFTGVVCLLVFVGGVLLTIKSISPPSYSETHILLWPIIFALAIGLFYIMFCAFELTIKEIIILVAPYFKSKKCVKGIAQRF